MLNTSQIFYIKYHTHKYPNLPIPVLFTFVAGGDRLQIQRVTVTTMHTQPWTVDRGHPPACGGTRQGSNNPSGYYNMLHRS
jgi:hypothetical protein